MARAFIVIGKSGAPVTNLNNLFIKLDKVHRRSLGRDDVDLSLAEDGMKRVLRKDVFDVGDKQFLMLLLVMNAEDEERLDFCENFFARVRNEIVDVGIDRGTVAPC